MKKHIPILIPLLLVAILYLPFLQNAFVSDDIGGIVNVASRWTWLEAIHWPRMIHLGVTIQYWTYHLFGLVPWPFRLTNILFHAGNVVLVWMLVKKISKPTVAFIASLLFAIHPLAIEAVTWISGGVYSQYTFFFLLSFVLYVYSTSRISHLSSLITFLLSLLISEKAVPLVFLFILYEWMYGTIKKNWKRLIPYFLISIGFILFYVSRLGIRISGLEQANYQTISGFYNPLYQVSIAISSYIELFIYPMKLTLYHSLFRYTPWELVVRIVVTALYIVLAVYGMVKKKPFGFWLSWVIVGLGITLLPIKIGWIVAERYAYLAMIGFSVVVGIMFDHLLSSKRWNVVVTCFVVVVVLALCARTIVRNNDWRTEDSLWVATAISSPTDPHSWNNMGDVYGRHGEYEKSIEAFTRATQINPNYADAYHNIGNTYVHMKKYQEAIPFFEKALSINPSLWESYQDLAFIAVANKEYDKAIGLFEKAVAINPQDAVLWTNIGVVYLEVGEQDKARYAMEQAIALDPSDQHARNLQKMLQSHVQ